MNSICHLVIGPTLQGQRKSCKVPADTHVYLTQGFSLPDGFASSALHPERFLPKETFCAGAGPMDFHSIIAFIQELDKLVFPERKGVSRKIVVCGGPTRRSFTNTSLLLGAYMILKLDLKSSYTSYCFRGIDPKAFESYKDASSTHSDFSLSIADCWQAIERAKGFSWIAMPEHNAPYRWGSLDADAYAYYNDPLNADLHEIVPGHFFALRASKNLGGRLYVDR